MNDSIRLARVSARLEELEARWVAAAKDADRADHFGAMQEARQYRAAASEVRCIRRYAQRGKGAQ